MRAGIKRLAEKLPIPGAYLFFVLLYLAFTVFAFCVDAPGEIWAGFVKIVTSRSLLTTDYIALGGMGAAFLNAALTGFMAMALLLRAGTKPNGAMFMALFITTGFAFFGKNVLNVIPLTLGVYLYARFQKEPFSNYILNALLASTLSPVVSELCFMGIFQWQVELIIGMAAGVGVGFLLPPIISVTPRVHGGYSLYNAGFAGGVLAIFIVAITKATGNEFQGPALLSAGNNKVLAPFLYAIMLALMCIPLAIKKERTMLLGNMKSIFRHSGRLVSDYYTLYGNSAFFNMGLCGALGVTVTLLVGGQLNGAIIPGIFALTGFGAFGKHWRNCLPVMCGAFLGALLNTPPPTEPSNIVPILFCTGLAPIAGQFGVVWGVVAGFLHMAIVHHIGSVTGGINLYNNGFSAGFVALVLVPIILAWKRGKDLRETQV